MNAGLDQNSRQTIILASKNDGTTIVPLTASPITHRLSVSMTVGGDNGNNQGNAIVDENSRAVWTALSSSNDGSIIEVYGDPLTKALLMQ